VLKKKETSQQKQTRLFFENFATQWSKSAKDEKEDFYNIIKVRGDYVVSVVKKNPKKNSRIVDVACGTGDLVIQLLKLGYDAYGFDFVETMIKKAENLAKKENLPKGKFFVESFFSWNPKEKFDIISANGFIPYISEQQLYEFIKKSYRYLNKNGILIIDSRNRLFNCVSFNNYTKDEIKIGEISNLLEECIIFNKAKNLNEILKKGYKSKIKSNLEKHDIIKTKHGEVLVNKMYQYTPLQLVNVLKKNKFKILDIHPNHIHGISTGAKEKNPAIHKQIGEYLLDHNNLHVNLIPSSSSFTIVAKKQ